MGGVSSDPGRPTQNVAKSWAPNSKTGDLAPQAKILGNLDQTEAENASKRRNSGSEMHSDRLSS